MSSPTKLIIVCCHGIWLGGPSKGYDESEWLNADFQRGETPTFIEHIKAGIKCLSEDRMNSVLAFSGCFDPFPHLSLLLTHSSETLTINKN